MSTLFILDCNAGAEHGNYFEGQFWKVLDNVRSYSGNYKPDFAAVDSLMCFKKQDGLGALVLESEMERVKGLSGYPASAQWAPARIQKLADALSLSLERSDVRKYARFVCLVQKANYMQALKRAVSQSKLNHRCIWVVTPPATKVVLGQLAGFFFLSYSLEAPSHYRFLFNVDNYIKTVAGRMTLTNYCKRLAAIPPAMQWWNKHTSPLIWTPGLYK